MTGPVIWVVRILTVVFVLFACHLLLQTNPPHEAIIIVMAIVAVGAGLWARAERMRGNYLREENRKRVSQEHIPAASGAPRTSPRERIVERRYYSQGSRAAHVIIVLAAICGILSFIRSCIK